MELIDIAEEERHDASLTTFSDELFGDFVFSSFIVFEEDGDYSCARLKGRISDAAEFFEAFEVEDESIDYGMVMLFAIGLIIGGELCMVADTKMGYKILFELFLLNFDELIGILV